MPNKKTLDKQIKKRVIQRINNGAIEEVTSLIKNYPNQKLSIYTSLGVSQICTFLSKKYSLDEMINFWTKDEIDYARRQIVWFKKQPSIIWYDKDIDIKRLVNILKNKK